MLDKIAMAVENYKLDLIEDYVNEAKAAGFTPKEILEKGLTKGMDELGRRMANDDIFIPEVLMGANTMQKGLALIKDELVSSGDDSKSGTIVIGTVEGDLHDIGKNLVIMMVEGAGHKVYDLGVDVTVDGFINAAKEKNADIIGMSAMLTTTMPEMKKIVERINSEGLSVIPIIGGAPITEKYAENIGARYSYDAASAVNLVNSLLNN